eukprot:scaffold7731_cov90-Isochrysis_galbana.AAC.5
MAHSFGLASAGLCLGRSVGVISGAGRCLGVGYHCGGVRAVGDIIEAGCGAIRGVRVAVRLGRRCSISASGGGVESQHGGVVPLIVCRVHPSARLSRETYLSDPGKPASIYVRVCLYSFHLCRGSAGAK